VVGEKFFTRYFRCYILFEEKESAVGAN